MDIPNKTIEEFLRESNAIEGVYDEDSLIQAWRAWEYILSVRTMSPGAILKLHKILMLHQPHLRPDERGYFRRVSVAVGGKTMMEWREAPGAVENFCIELNDPGTDWKAAHIRFEQIHPFVDGNGRTGRILMNWQRVKILGEPPIVIHEGAEQREYYSWFR